jgi:Carbohydrate binding module (family 6).
MLKKLLSMVIASAIVATCFASLSAVLADDLFDVNAGAIAAYDFAPSAGGSGVYVDSIGGKDASVNTPNLGHGTAAIVDTPNGKGYQAIQHNAKIDASALKDTTNLTIMMYAKLSDRTDNYAAVMCISPGDKDNQYLWAIANGAGDQAGGQTSPANRSLRFEIATSGNVSGLSNVAAGHQTINGQTGYENGTGILDGGYHQLVMVQSGRQLLMYIDGALAQSSSSTALTNNRTIARLFGDTTGRYSKQVWISLLYDIGYNDPAINGTIDDLRIWGRALSLAEIQAANTALVGETASTIDNGADLLYYFDYDNVDPLTGVAENKVDGNPDHNLYLTKVEEVSAADSVVGDGAVYWKNKNSDLGRQQIGADFDYQAVLDADEGVTISTYFKTDMEAAWGDQARQFLFEIAPLPAARRNEGLARENFALALLYDNQIKFEVNNNGGDSDALWSNGIELSDGYHLLTVTQKKDGYTEIMVDGMLIQKGTMPKNIFGFNQATKDAGLKLNLGSNSIWGGRHDPEEGLQGTLEAFRVYDKVFSMEDQKALSDYYSNGVGGDRFGYEAPAEPATADVLGTIDLTKLAIGPDNGGRSGRAVMNSDETFTAREDNAVFWNFKLPNQEEIVGLCEENMPVYAKFLYKTVGSVETSACAHLAGELRDNGGILNSGEVPNKGDGVWHTAVVELNVNSSNQNNDVNLEARHGKATVSFGGWIVISTNTDDLEVPASYKTEDCSVAFKAPVPTATDFSVWQLRGDYDGGRRSDAVLRVDGSMSFKNYGNESPWNMYADRGQNHRYNGNFFGVEKYNAGDIIYLKALVKGTNLDDPTRRTYSGRPAANLFYLRQSLDKTVHTGIGSADPKYDGVWQSVVIPIDFGEIYHNQEGALYNTCRGDNYLAQISPYMVFSTDDTPLPIPAFGNAGENAASAIVALKTTPEEVDPEAVAAASALYGALDADGLAQAALFNTSDFDLEAHLAVAEVAAEAKDVKLAVNDLTVITGGDDAAPTTAVKLQAEYSSKFNGWGYTRNNDGEQDGSTGSRGLIGATTTDGMWLSYENVDFDGGANKVSIRYCNGTGNQAAAAGNYVSFRIDSPEADAFASITIPGTGGWGATLRVLDNTFVSDITGKHTVYVTFHKPDQVDKAEHFGDIDWFEISGIQPAVVESREITVDDKDLIEGARAGYDALSDDAKALINLAVLEEAEALLDQALADVVIDMISEFGETDGTNVDLIEGFDAEPVAQELIDAVLAARAAYDELTDAQKALVDADNYAVLEEAEAAIEDDVLAAVQKAIDDVLAIEELEYEDGDQIAAARELIDQLKPEWQAKLTDVDKFEQVEEDYEALVAKLISDVVDAIDDLPSVDDLKLDDKEAVEAARELYDALPEDLKDEEFITNYQKLLDLEAKLPTLRLPGDADDNGKVNATDATTILRNLFWTGTKRPTINESNADVDDNGKVNATDATTILRHLFWTGDKQPPLL